MLSCRLLGIEPDWQKNLFEFYQAMLEAHIAQLRREQKYDDGIVDVKGSEILIQGQPQVRSPALPIQPLPAGLNAFCGCFSCVPGALNFGWSFQGQPPQLQLACRVQTCIAEGKPLSPSPSGI